MEAVVIFNPDRPIVGKVVTLGRLKLDDVEFGVAVTKRLAPKFDPASMDNYSSALVEVLAFSCNYRDRVIALLNLRSGMPGPIPIGSDFVGIVRQTGRMVKTVTPGDRVIGDNTYPMSGRHETLQGVPSNGVSAGFLILHESKLAKIPDSMPLEAAAGFSITAQTCRGMIRKVGIRAHERCIVTGASSNTALFALATLRKMDVETYAITTGLRDFTSVGVTATIRVKAPVDQSIVTNEIVKQLIREHGGADVVIDCFADIYATSVLPLLKQGGRYVTCGVYAQLGMEPQASVSSTDWRNLLASVIMSNITVYGNCLGSASDLQEAIAAYAEDRISVPCDCTLRSEDGVEFVRRSFGTADRFGKAILMY